MRNVPSITMGLIAVNRNCFPIELSQKRRRKVAEECRAKSIPIVELETTIENEHDVVNALNEIAEKKVNALAIYPSWSRQPQKIRAKTSLMDGATRIAAC